MGKPWLGGLQKLQGHGPLRLAGTQQRAPRHDRHDADDGPGAVTAAERWPVRRGWQRSKMARDLGNNFTNHMVIING